LYCYQVGQTHNNVRESEHFFRIIKIILRLNDDSLVKLYTFISNFLKSYSYVSFRIPITPFV